MGRTRKAKMTAFSAARERIQAMNTEARKRSDTDRSEERRGRSQ